MIIPISRNNIEVIEQCIPGLQRELDRSDLKDAWDIQALVDHLVNFQVYAFLQVETGLAGVISIMVAPKIKILNLFWLGKDPENKTSLNMAEVDEFLVEAAKLFECKKIVCDGRKGWSKLIEPLDYHEDGRVYVKKV